MFSNQRKTIGIICEAVDLEFPKQVCQGVIEETEKLGYNVAVFSIFGKYGYNEDFFAGDSHLLHLPPYEDFAGIILLLDTMQDPNMREYVIEQVRTRCTCPIVSLREALISANNLLVDNTTCMESIIRHFIEVHKFTNLCFLTGPEDRWYAVERLNCFQRIMREYQLPVTEHQTFYGDFWYNMSEEACDWFLQDGRKPDAIICANDHMALAISSELIKRGYAIPRDICVSGYDGLTDTSQFSPSITTAQIKFHDMGAKAAQIIHEKQDCPSKVDNYYFGTDMIVRESCGCLQVSDQEVIISRRDYYEAMQSQHGRQIQFNYFSTYLNDNNDSDKMFDQIEQYIFCLENYKDYAICFCEDLAHAEDFSDYTDVMELQVGFRNEKKLDTPPVKFSRNELLPAIVTSDEPQVWYFNSLHSERKIYGYEAVQFHSVGSTANIYFDWNMIINNKIHIGLEHQKTQQLINELQYMYDRDYLTGLYNRRGLDNHTRHLFNQSRENHTPIFIAIVDMDGMKIINDTYGHIEGDFALCKVTEAFRACCDNRFIISRTGGDEFSLIGGNVDEQDGKLCLQNIQHFLDVFNKSAQKPYQIHASVGYVCRIAQKDDTYETYMTESDAIMYRNKVAYQQQQDKS